MDREDGRYEVWRVKGLRNFCVLFMQGVLSLDFWTHFRRPPGHSEDQFRPGSDPLFGPENEMKPEAKLRTLGMPRRGRIWREASQEALASILKEVVKPRRCFYRSENGVKK